MHVYFSGIGGTAIGPLALLALDASYLVDGSDLASSPMSELVEKRGVKIAYTQADHIKNIHKENPIDWLVYSSALPEDHPELKYAKENGIKTSKRAGFLNLLLKKLDLKLIAVSGTHGKTTTTGMLIWLFKELGLPVSYSIGTTISFGPPACYEKGSKYFVYECDEFDRNFLEFNPELSLITALDYDHPDTYPTPADYFQAFGKFTEQSKLAVTWQSVADMLMSDGHLFVVPDDRNFDEIKLAGLHNRRNAWLASTAINRLGLVVNDVAAWEDLLKKVSSFPGTSRRFEKLANNLYTDYAHHPKEIEATIDMARELNDKVVVVYQPHQNIRQHELLKENAYKDCFSAAKKVYWLPTYLSREYTRLATIPPEKLAKTVEGTEVEVADMNEALAENIKEYQTNGDLVLAMSAGDLDLWLREKFQDV